MVKNTQAEGRVTLPSYWEEAKVELAALVLSALATCGVFAGANGLATHQYAAADSLAMAQYGQVHVAIQHVTVVGHRAA